MDSAECYTALSSWIGNDGHGSHSNAMRSAVIERNSSADVTVVLRAQRIPQKDHENENDVVRGVAESAIERRFSIEGESTALI